MPSASSTSEDLTAYRAVRLQMFCDNLRIDRTEALARFGLEFRGVGRTWEEEADLPLTSRSLCQSAKGRVVCFHGRELQRSRR